MLDPASRADRNGDDGFDIGGPGTKLFFNRADRNADLGFESMGGVFAFGNRASENGNPSQCLNVTCR